MALPNFCWKRLGSSNLGVANINFNEQFSLFTVISSITSVVVISVAYFAIWIKTRRHNLPRKTSRSQEHDRRLAKTLCIVTGLSILFCLPSGITLALKNYTQNIHSFGFQITIVAMYTNSFLNPIVYCFKMPEFKQALGKLFCRYFGNRLNFQENSLGSYQWSFLKVYRGRWSTLVIALLKTGYGVWRDEKTVPRYISHTSCL